MENIFYKTGVVSQFNDIIDQETKMSKTRDTERDNRPNTKKLKEDGVIVSMKDKSFAEFLKILKQNVNQAKLVLKSNISEKQEKGTCYKMDATEICDKVPGATTTVQKSKEVCEAVCMAVSVKAETVEVKAAYGNTGNVTVTLVEAKANKSIKK